MTVYRTNGAWGSGLGVNLTAAQFDTNFYELRTEVDALKANPLTPNGIASISVAGTAMTVVLNQGQQLGPFPLPVLQFRWRDAWAPATLFAVLDLFKVDNQGLFSSLQPHTSAATFDPAAVGAAVNAGSFVIGTLYKITTVGTTNFTLIGASSNTVGVEFTATGAGSGTGTASPKHYHQLIGVGTNAAFGDLVDVQITGVGADHLIAWNAVSSRWTNRTPAQATALLSNLVGDSGSGGTKGLVPAPAAGDAAANKFLSAAGGWAAVVSGINQLTGDVTAGPGTGSQAATLATVNSNVGTFTLATVTVDAKGRTTAAASGTGTSISGLTAGTPPYDPATLLELSVPSVGSRSGTISDIAGAGVPIEVLTPTEGGTVTPAASTRLVILTPAAALNAVTLALPAAAALKDRTPIEVVSTQEIVALSATSSGATVVGAPVSLAPNGGVAWVYRQSATTWYRVRYSREPKVQVFTGSGTYTPSPGARAVNVIGIGGGGGGGGGARQASGTGASGGGGGGGAGSFYSMFRLSDLGSSVAVTIGAGGSAGAAAAADNTAGGNGGVGGTTQFGNFAHAGGGGGGAGGQLASNSGGGGGGVTGPSSFGGSSTGATGGSGAWGVGASGGSGAGGSFTGNTGAAGGGGGCSAAGVAGTGGGASWGATGGGAGGGVSSAPGSNNGAAGGPGLRENTARAAGGTSGSPNGVSTTMLLSYTPGIGGSGGYGNATGNGGNGGAGTQGSGGGGGGSVLNGSTAGAGGAGGNGILVITEFF